MGNNCCAKTPQLETIWLPDFARGLPSLSGKKVAITGTTSGVGLVAARECLKKGAAVIVLNRASERAEKSFQSLQREFPEGKVQQLNCDLMNFESVRGAAKELRTICTEGGLDVLCCNAGIMNFPDKATTDGFDQQMQTNHLSHFLLVKEVLPVLQVAAKEKGDARIVIQSSEFRNKGKPLEEQFLQKNGGKLGGAKGGLERYHQSKLCNSLLTYALDARLAEAGHKNIKVVCCTPGIAATSLFNNTSATSGATAFHPMLVRLTSCFAGAYMQSEEDGAMPLLAGIAGQEVKSGDLLTPSMGQDNESKGPVKTICRPLPKSHQMCEDAKAQELMWSASEKAIGEPWKI